MDELKGMLIKLLLDYYEHGKNLDTIAIDADIKPILEYRDKIVSRVELPVKPATCGQYLYELQKKYIEIREGFAKNPHTFWVTDEMYMIGQILNQYGVQKDKLPLTVDKFIEQQSKLSV